MTAVKRFTTTGFIARPDPSQKRGWWRVDIDPGIAQFYQYLYQLGGRRWQPPLNGCHLTFIRGEKETVFVDSINEGWYHVPIEVEYENRVLTNGRAYFLLAKSQQLDYLRARLGLTIPTGYHITLAINPRNPRWAQKV